MSALNELQDIMAVTGRTVGTAAQLEATAQDQVEAVKQQEVSTQKVMDASTTLVGRQQLAVDNSQMFTEIAKEVEQATLNTAKVASQVAGVDVTQAQAAEVLAAPARASYMENVKNPSVDGNIKRYQNQVDIYADKLASLMNDTTFLGGIKRAALEGATRRRLRQSNEQLSTARQRKIGAANVMNASLNAGNNFAVSSTAISRAQAKQSLIQADSALSILASKSGTAEAKKEEVGQILMLDKVRLDHFMREYDLLSKRGAANSQVIGALQTKLYAQSVQANAAKTLKTTEQKVEYTSEYEDFVLAELKGDKVATAEHLKLYPDPQNTKAVEESNLVQMFQVQMGTRGTNHQAIIRAKDRKQRGVQLSVDDLTMLALQSSAEKQEATRINNKYDAELKGALHSDAKRRAVEDKRKKELTMLQTDPALIGRLYTQSLDRLEVDSTEAIEAGALLINNDKEQLVDPANKYSAMLTPKFQEILVSDDFKAIDLGFVNSAHVQPQVNVMLEGVADYITTKGEFTKPSALSKNPRFKDKSKPRLIMDDVTLSRIDTVAKGLADYYNVQMQQNIDAGTLFNPSNSGSLLIPGIGVGKSTIDLTNSAQMKELILRALQTKSGDANRFNFVRKEQ